MAWKATKASGKAPFPLVGHSATARDKQIYIFGGAQDKNTHNNNVFLLNTGKPPPQKQKQPK